jgi:hypothetical protein
MRIFRRSACCLAVVLLIAVGVRANRSGGPRFSQFIHAQPWPQADALFHSNPKWLGGDDAYSVDLGNGRVLWLFADSFIATSTRHVRSESVMINNSLAIESGYDPSTASIQFYWRTKDGKPESFFPRDGDIWYWPGDAIVAGDKLFIFLMAIRSTNQGLGFEGAGSKAVVISNFRRAPPEWNVRPLNTPSNDFHIFLSGSLMQVGDYVYIFTYQDPGFNICLARWTTSQLASEDLSTPEWWNGDRWVLQNNLRRAPTAIVADGQAEFTVNFQPALNQFLMIQTVGAGQADIGSRRAPTLTGPWTALEPFFRPPEYELPDIMIYAAKCHPELRGAPLVLTYATNKFKLEEILAAPNLYYPRFLKATLNPDS